MYYLQGFSGHGVALAGMAGRMAAQAIAGQAERFDLFARIAHRRFPGGRAHANPGARAGNDVLQAARLAVKERT
jgi:gamma-glutamylputrescine oxidase